MLHLLYFLADKPVSLIIVSIERFNDFIFLVRLDMLRYGFGSAITDALQIILFASKLNFANDDFPFAVHRLDVRPIKLVVPAVLIALLSRI